MGRLLTCERLGQRQEITPHQTRRLRNRQAGGSLHPPGAYAGGYDGALRFCALEDWGAFRGVRVIPTHSLSEANPKSEALLFLPGAGLW